TGKPPKGLSREALDELMRYHWPGNVRELQNLLERLFILSDQEVIEWADLPMLRVSERSDGSDDPYRIGTYQEFKEHVEREFLIRKLKENEGNVSKTARELKMQRSNLYKKLEKYGIGFRKEQGS
ncbi:sigma-54-dependent Fis family transcriptional regulator, partial [bacterium]